MSTGDKFNKTNKATTSIQLRSTTLSIAEAEKKLGRTAKPLLTYSKL